MKNIKLLSIGNSFSTDAQKWLHQIAETAGAAIYCANLYIGGCSLQQHWNNYLTQENVYDYEVNGFFKKKISLPKALSEEAWDVITLQQVSGYSGIIESFEPYLSDLINNINNICPDTEILLHKTWAYDNSSTHPDFIHYDSSEEKMYDAICKVYSTLSVKTGLKVIPSGDIIQYLRKNMNIFSSVDGNIPLTRDGFHLSLNYGRFAAGLVWLKILTGIPAKNVAFIPEVEGAVTDPDVIAGIKDAVDKII